MTVAKQALVQVRLHKDLREKSLQALENIRINAGALPEMTSDEINAEIAAVRAERKAGR